jgi:hypothetical protein
MVLECSFSYAWCMVVSQLACLVLTFSIKYRIIQNLFYTHTSICSPWKDRPYKSYEIDGILNISCLTNLVEEIPSLLISAQDLTTTLARYYS